MMQKQVNRTVSPHVQAFQSKHMTANCHYFSHTQANQ